MDMETSPSYFDHQDLSIRNQFHRYRKRHSTSGTSTPIVPLMQFSPAKTQFSTKRSFPADTHGGPDMDSGFDSIRHSLKACKQEGDSFRDGVEIVWFEYKASSCGGYIDVAESSAPA
ncbi:hypothetical protein K1719_025843 [Acacia pycnantha]|nr:hypothetical protein K1719_025843 [Acacia pycnantha]